MMELAKSLCVFHCAHADYLFSGLVRDGQKRYSSTEQETSAEAL